PPASTLFPYTTLFRSFGGKSSVTIAAKSFATSDDIALSFDYGDVLAITEYVSGSWTKLTQHTQGGGVVTSYATPSKAGDKTADLDRKSTRLNSSHLVI